MIECRTMAGPERFDAYTLMRQFRGDEPLLGDALALFVDRPDYGFVWLGYEDGVAAACASVSYGIATDAGGLAALVRDVYVAPDHRGHGLGTALLVTLQARLDQLEVRAIEAVIGDDAGLRALLASRGYVAVPGTKLSLRRR